MKEAMLCYDRDLLVKTGQIGKAFSQHLWTEFYFVLSLLVIGNKP